MRRESVPQLASIGRQVHVLLSRVVNQSLVCAWVRGEFGSHKPIA